MSFIAASNFVSVSVSSPPTGLKQYAVNNLALFTNETPVNVAVTFAAPGIYVSPTDVLADWGAGSEAYAQAVLVFSQSPNILDGSGTLIIVPLAASGTNSTLAEAIPNALLINFFGGALWAGLTPNDAAVLAASTACQSLRVKLFASSHLTASVAGYFTTIQQATQTHTRCLLSTVKQGSESVASAKSARLMAAAYAGRALSVNFDGANTTATMHLKTLVGIAPDTGISQTQLIACEAAGVDTYPSVGGGAQYIGKVYSTGGNDYFDNVYNLDWLVFSLQVAGFNALATTSTKLPQTEPGMALLKGAYINVLQQALANGFIAPGTWNSAELFGKPADLRRNILNQGYYIYSLPVTQQTQATREAREAPLVRIAVKFAGAIQSSDVLVSINK
jgi:hypothetical protein